MENSRCQSDGFDFKAAAYDVLIEDEPRDIETDSGSFEGFGVVTRVPSGV